jgi:GNAT superfamily N-acetyltransferase
LQRLACDVRLPGIRRRAEEAPERVTSNVHAIRELEELAIRAWPALETLEDDGWIHRFAGGYTRRANSVHPLGPSARALEAKIAEAEALYAQRDLPPVFKMTAASAPAGLDAALASRVYAVEAQTNVLIADLASESKSEVALVLSWIDATAWREAFHRMSRVAPERQGLHDRILSAIWSPAAFASISEEGRVVACALGVVDSGWLGVFDVIVDEPARRCGHAERLMRGLMAWGRQMGASRAYLQVMVGNAPAHALYAKLGFREAYSYWYRVKR